MRPEAAELLAERLNPDDRVLVTGAGGWFGRTLLHLIADVIPSHHVLATTGRPRSIDVGGRSQALREFNVDEVRAFGPTLVVDLAFLTREKALELGCLTYVAENCSIMSQALQALECSSVRAAVAVSSGAALGLPGAPATDVGANPYGFLKRAGELLALDVATRRGIGLTVARAWSLSGTLVTRPADYAFSDLIRQARSSTIEIRARHEVWRRYVLVEDFLACALSTAVEGRRTVLDSGGDLVELGQLAQLVSRVTGAVTVRRAAPDGTPADRYHSDGRDWAETCHRLSFRPATLEEQVRRAAASGWAVAASQGVAARGSRPRP